MTRSVAEGSSLSGQSILIDCVFAATLAALFSGIHDKIGPVKVQLADILALAAIFLGTLKGFATPRLAVVPFCILCVYLLYYCVSALFVELSLGVTKIVQIVLLAGFLFVAFGYYRTRPTDRLLVLSSVLIVGVLVINIGWHVAHGKYVGWKELNEPKTIFTLLPVLLILLFTRFGGSWKQPLPLLAGIAAAVVIFLSGERKAYIFALMALIVWSGPIKMWRYALAAALIAPLFLVAASMDRSGYLHRQMGSFEELLPGGSARSASSTKLLDESRATTLSNAEREFSNRLARSMWIKKPVLGIGTGAFAIAVGGDLSIPEEFRMGIHGEFFRTLYENGIVGLALYLCLWISSLIAVAIAWPMAPAHGDPNLNKIKLLCLTMLAVYLAFEASKGLTVVCTLLLPFIVALAPQPRPQARGQLLRPVRRPSSIGRLHRYRGMRIEP